jgi:cobalt-zinc-cadmium resistance protein CzcA
LPDLKRYKRTLDYYDTNGKALTEELITHASRAFEEGEIDFLQYVQLLEQAGDIKINYLDNLLMYNQTILETNYIL